MKLQEGNPVLAKDVASLFCIRMFVQYTYTKLKRHFNIEFSEVASNIRGALMFTVYTQFTACFCIPYMKIELVIDWFCSSSQLGRGVKRRS